MNPHESHPLSIILIHDLALARDSLRYAFTYGAEGMVFGAYSSNAIDDIPVEVEPTVILLSSAVQFTGQAHSVRVVQRYWPNAAVVLLGPLETADQLRCAIGGGVRGWIGAEASFPELLAVIQIVAHGHTVFGAEAHMLFRDWAGIVAFDEAAYCAHLSEREHEIVQCVRDGCTNPEIADQLGIVPKTVEAHLNRIFRKRTITSRAELLN